MQREAGYSLLELLVALAILALLAMAVAQVGSFTRDTSLAAETERLEQAIHDGQRRAIREARVVELRVNEDGSRLSDGDDAVLAGSAKLNTSAPMRFDAQGFANGGTIDVSLGNDRISLTIEPLTGRMTTKALP